MSKNQPPSRAQSRHRKTFIAESAARLIRISRRRYVGRRLALPRDKASLRDLAAEAIAAGKGAKLP